MLSAERVIVRNLAFRILNAVVFIGFALWQGQSFAQGLDLNRPNARHSIAASHYQNILFKALLASHGKPEAEQLSMIKQVEAYLFQFSLQERHMIQVATKQDVHDLIERTLIPSLNIEDEFRTRFSQKVAPYFIAVPTTQEAESELERMSTAVNARLDELARGLADNHIDAQFLALAQQVPLGRALPLAEWKAMLARYFLLPTTPKAVDIGFTLITDPMRLKVVEVVHRYLDKQFAELKNVGSTIANSDRLQFKLPAWKILFRTLIDDYFQAQDDLVQKSILAQLLDLPPNAGEEKIFEVMVMNSGPQFQKLLQIFGRDEGFKESLQTLWKRLESNTRETPWRFFEPEVPKILFKDGSRLESISSSPLGIGTMAQVHRALILDAKGNRRDAVVRFLKPEIEKRVNFDNQILRKIAQKLDANQELRAAAIPLLQPFLDELEKMALRETDISRTIQMQKDAAKVYNIKIATQRAGNFEVHVPEIIETQHPGVMVQEFVGGTSFEKFATRSPEQAREIGEKLAKLWLGESIFSGGFYHADLHQGNMRVEMNDSGIRVHLLDYGMADRLSLEIQNNFLSLGVAINSANVEMMTRAFWALSIANKNSVTQDQFKEKLQAAMRSNKAKDLSVPEWVATASAFGLQFIPEFASFNRGAVLVQRLLEDVGSKESLGTLVRKLGEENPMRIVQLVRNGSVLKRGDWLSVLGEKLNPWSTSARVKTCSELF